MRIAARHTTRSDRAGLTILEVLLALAIFLGALVMLGQLMTTGSQAAGRSHLQTQAVLRCQSKLSEVLSGVEPLQAVNQRPFADDPDQRWKYSVVVGEGPHLDLLDVQVQVQHVNSRNLVDASYTLRRYYRDPQLYLDAALTAAEESSSSE